MKDIVDDSASSGKARKSTVNGSKSQRGRNEVTRVPLELGVVAISIGRRQLPLHLMTMCLALAG